MGDNRLVWFSAGLAAAVLASALGAPARAQIAPIRPAGETLPAGPSAPTNGRGDNADVDDSFAAPGIPPPVPIDDPSESPEDIDPLDTQPRAGQRPVVEDGDPNAAQEQPLVRDGVVDAGEPLPPQDGGDQTLVDTRPPEDISLFEDPPENFDPLLFQIEDLDPIADNRATRRLFNLEPYDPIGIKIGSFVLFPELELGGSSYSNVFLSPSGVSDVAFDVQPSVRLVSNWSSHALELRGRGALSYYKEFSSENDQAYLVEARGRLDVTKLTNVQVLGSREQLLESRSAINASSAGERIVGDINRGEVTLNHRFNRLSLQFRGTVAEFSYSNTLNQGVLTINADRNYTEYAQAGRATWEFKPALSVFGEVETQQRDYGQVTLTDGLNRTSSGERYRGGLSFGNVGQILRGEISLGYGVQTPDDPRLIGVDGLLVDANATWRVSEQTSVLFNAQTDVTETTQAGIDGSLNRNIGVEVRHELRKYLIGIAGFNFNSQESTDGSIAENELRGMVGLEYFANRDTVLFGNYIRSDFDAVGTLEDYTNNEVHIGVRLRR